MAKTKDENKLVSVELICGRATDTGTQSAGQVIDVPSDEAKRMLERGIAKVPEANDIETRG